MGTRSYIALQIEEDEYLTIFCHYNGYPDDNGAILAEHYDKQEKVESLIQLGDLYFLGVFCFQRHLVSVKCSGGLKVTRENERIPPYRT